MHFYQIEVLLKKVLSSLFVCSHRLMMVGVVQIYYLGLACFSSNMKTFRVTSEGHFDHEQD